MLHDMPFAIWHDGLSGSPLTMVSSISKGISLCCCNKQSLNLNGLTQSSTQHPPYEICLCSRLDDSLCSCPPCSDSANQPTLTLWYLTVKGSHVNCFGEEIYWRIIMRRAFNPWLRCNNHYCCSHFTTWNRSCSPIQLKGSWEVPVHVLKDTKVAQAGMNPQHCSCHSAFHHFSGLVIPLSIPWTHPRLMMICYPHCTCPENSQQNTFHGKLCPLKFLVTL